MIRIKDMTKSFENGTPLRNVNATVNDGDIIAVIGPSGTGKSTLIRCIDMLEIPTSGEIIIDGETVDPKDSAAVSRLHKKVGMVFQRFNLFKNLTVIENVMIPQIELLGRSRQEAYDKAISILKDVGLAGKALSYPDQISGGQQQRAAIARTLAMDPDIILLDEPTSALDPTSANEVFFVIRKIAESGKTMMIVTHEMEFARKVGNRVFYMDAGGIYEDGTPDEIFDHPKKELTRRFIQRIQYLEFDVDTKAPDYPEAVAKIEQYSLKYQIPEERKYYLIRAFEEFCLAILLPDANISVMSVTIEASPKSDDIRMFIDYDGGIDPLSSGDDLALSVLKTAVASAEYSHFEKNERGFTDRLDILIKKA